MKPLRLCIAVLIALAACASEEKTQAAADDAARSIIANVIGPDYAGVTLTPVLDCIVETSTPEERNALVANAVDFGITGSVSARARQLEQRPAAQSCIAAKGVVKPRLGEI